MAFTDQQRKFLSAKLKRRFVKTRSHRGERLSYVEGWHVISEANRIFGFDSWDRTTLSPKCIWEDQVTGVTAIMYATTVRVTVRAGDVCITREGIGTGFGRSYSPEVAHEIALKAAETDATKRALATFGNPFGLALYDKEQAGVTGSRVETKVPEKAPKQVPANTPRFRLALSIRKPDGSVSSATSLDAFVKEVHASVDLIGSLQDLYAFWENNIETFKQVRATQPDGLNIAEDLIHTLKEKAKSFRSAGSEEATKLPAPPQALAIPKEKRLRSQVHLDYVRQQPCLVCGRQPSHAHHVRFGQRGALGLKVSDEFTVPLCALHHDALHRVGNEKSWWVGQGIDPLKAAAELWAKSPRAGGNSLQTDLEDRLRLLNGNSSAAPTT